MYSIPSLVISNYPACTATSACVCISRSGEAKPHIRMVGQRVYHMLCCDIGLHFDVKKKKMLIYNACFIKCFQSSGRIEKIYIRTSAFTFDL